MKWEPKKIIVIGLTTGASIVAGFGYTMTTKPVFEVKAKATILRSKITNPDLEDGASKNRWVWVKDGLTTQQELVADEFLSDAIDKNDVLRARYTDFKAVQSPGSGVEEADIKGAFAKIVSNSIKVEYSGGDSSSYVITVRDTDPQFAKVLASMLMVRLESIAIASQLGTFTKAMDSIKSQMTSLKVEGISPPSGAPVNEQEERFQHYQTLKQAYGRLLVARSIYSAEGSERFQLVVKPYAPLHPVWPNKPLILIAMAMGGFFLGLSLVYANSLFRNKE